MASNAVLHPSIHSLFFCCCGIKTRSTAGTSEVGDSASAAGNDSGYEAEGGDLQQSTGGFNCVYQPQSACSCSPVPQKPLTRLSASFPATAGLASLSASGFGHNGTLSTTGASQSPRRYRKRHESPMFNPYLRPRANSLEEIHTWSRRKEAAVLQLALADNNQLTPVSEPNLCTLPNLSDADSDILDAESD